MSDYCLIGRKREGEEVRSFIFWDFMGNSFSLGLFVKIKDIRAGASVRLRWLKCDRPMKAFFKFNKWNSKDDK